MITPTSGSSRATLNASVSSNSVFGRNALRTSGRLIVILAMPPAVSYQMSSYSPDRCQSIKFSLLEQSLVWLPMVADPLRDLARRRGRAGAGRLPPRPAGPRRRAGAAPRPPRRTARRRVRALHLGHDGPAQGRAADAGQPRRLGRGLPAPARDRRGGPLAVA